MQKTIKRALISVFHKENLEDIVKQLQQLNVEIYSTGGTQKFIESKDIPVKAVEDLTEYPSILGGRVKTLHPKVFGGILARENDANDLSQLEEYSIPTFDLVVVDLYPFEKTVADLTRPPSESGHNGNENTIIEKIDIGGIALIRAAAKNYSDTLVISAQEQYADLLNILQKNEGQTTVEERRGFAAKAFAVSSHYDTAIFNYFNQKESLTYLRQSASPAQILRYGENPHQQGIYYGDFEAMFEQLHGKAISYNNLLDIDAAVNIIGEFEETTFAVLKHNNTCGLASRENLLSAWKASLAGDPVSAFGGVLIANRPIDIKTAESINQLFFEVLIAPVFEEEALNILKAKKNRILLVQKQPVKNTHISRTVLNGILYQQKDQSMEDKAVWNFASAKQPDESEAADLLFANKAVKHLKSNGIALVKNKQLVGMGCGQTSRVDALKHAITKAELFNLSLEGAVMASDAFFPFPDCVEIAHKAGVKSVIQPGGSIKDKDSISYCDQNDMAMVLTGVRHFKH